VQYRHAEVMSRMTRCARTSGRSGLADAALDGDVTFTVQQGDGSFITTSAAFGVARVEAGTLRNSGPQGLRLDAGIIDASVDGGAMHLLNLRAGVVASLANGGGGTIDLVTAGDLTLAGAVTSDGGNVVLIAVGSIAAFPVATIPVTAERLFLTALDAGIGAPGAPLPLGTAGIGSLRAIATGSVIIDSPDARFDADGVASGTGPVALRSTGSVRVQRLLSPDPVRIDGPAGVIVLEQSSIGFVPTRPAGVDDLVATAATIALTGVFFAASGAAIVGGSRAIADRAEAVEVPAPAPRITVPVMTVERLNGFEVDRRFAGQVEATQETGIAFETGGTVTEILVDEGDVVAAGEALARLDTRLLIAERNRLLASRRALDAQRELARLTAKRSTVSHPEPIAERETRADASAGLFLGRTGTRNRINQISMLLVMGMAENRGETSNPVSASARPCAGRSGRPPRSQRTQYAWCCFSPGIAIFRDQMGKSGIWRNRLETRGNFGRSPETRRRRFFTGFCHKASIRPISSRAWPCSPVFSNGL
jgi:hypothetical protein